MKLTITEIQTFLNDIDMTAFTPRNVRKHSELVTKIKSVTCVCPKCNIEKNGIKFYSKQKDTSIYTPLTTCNTCVKKGPTYEEVKARLKKSLETYTGPSEEFLKEAEQRRQERKERARLETEEFMKLYRVKLKEFKLVQHQNIPSVTVKVNTVKFFTKKPKKPKTKKVNIESKEFTCVKQLEYGELFFPLEITVPEVKKSLTLDEQLKLREEQLRQEFAQRESELLENFQMLLEKQISKNIQTELELADVKKELTTIKNNQQQTKLPLYKESTVKPFFKKKHTFQVKNGKLVSAKTKHDSMTEQIYPKNT